MHPTPTPPPPLLLAVVGSRTYPRLDLVRGLVRRLARWSERTGRGVTIISGTDPERSKRAGVDEVAAAEARRLGVPTIIHEADWTLLGKSAGPRRNTRIVDDCDSLVAFWDLASRGSADVIRKALYAGKLRRVYGPDGQEVPVEIVGEALRRVLG
jgi:hypothetical protein